MKSEKIFSLIVVAFIVAAQFTFSLSAESRSVNIPPEEVALTPGSNLVFSVGTDYGVMNSEGKILLRPIFDSAQVFEAGDNVWCGKRNGNWVIVSGDGRVIYEGGKTRPENCGCGVLKVLKDGNVSLFNTFTLTLAPLKPYASIDNFYDNMAIVKDGDGKFGVLDSEGKEVVNPSYSYISRFNEGVALTSVNSFRSLDVMSKVDRKLIKQHDGQSVIIVRKLAFINRLGRTLEYLNLSEFEDARNFSCKRAAVYSSEKGKWGFIDETGILVIPLKYDEVGSFVNGYAKVKKGDKWGFIDVEGKERIKIRYDEVGEVSGDFARVCSKGEWGFESVSGQTIKCQYRKVSDFQDGLAVVSDGILYGLINSKGEAVTPMKYVEINLSGGIASVKTSRGYGYVDNSGKEILMPANNAILPFRGRWGAAKKGSVWNLYDNTGRKSELGDFDDVFIANDVVVARKRNKYFRIAGAGVPEEITYKIETEFINGFGTFEIGGRYGYVSEDGKVAVPPTYSHCGPFANGYAIVSDQSKVYIINEAGGKLGEAELAETDYSNDKAFISYDSKTGMIDREGKCIVPLIYDSLSDFSCGRSKCLVNGLYGYINEEGKEVIAPQFNSASDFTVDLATVEIAGKYGMIDTAGEYKMSPNYSAIYHYRDFVNAYKPDMTALGLTESEIESGVESFGNKVVFLQNDKYGVMSIPDFKIVNPANYEMLGACEGRLHVRQNGKIGILDHDGFEIVAPFYESLSAVDENSDHYIAEVNARFGIFSMNSMKEIIPVKYDKISVTDDSSYIVTLNGKYGLLNTHGNEILQPIYSSFQSSGNVYRVTQNSKKGIVSRSGKVIAGCKYDDIEPYESCYVVRLGKKSGILDASGNVALAIQYENVAVYNNNIFYAKFGKAAGYGILNSQGKMMSKPKYRDIFYDRGFYITTDAKGKVGAHNSAGELIFNNAYSTYEIDGNTITLYP